MIKTTWKELFREVNRPDASFTFRALILSLTGLLLLTRPVHSIRSEAYQCDRSYIANQGSGVISHYNYPFNYTANLQCTTRFHVPYLPSTWSWRICFSFQRFQLTDSDSCFDDYLSFNNEQRYCGSGHSSGSDTTGVYSNIFNSPLCWTLTSAGIFSIEFASRYSSSNLGYYANYTITDERCNINNDSTFCKSIQGACQNGEFRCFNGGCIPGTLLCDGVPQCHDESDETYTHARCAGKQNVTACSFEEDTCNMTIFGWVRDRQSLNGPKIDNTFREFGKGSFLYAEFPEKDIAYANFTFSPPLQSSGHQCLSFFYYMSGYVGKFAVRLRTKDGWKISWIRSGSQVVAWLQAEINIPPHVLPVYEISFQAVNNPTAVNNIGLDDISIIEGRCFRDDISCTFDVDACGWRPHLSLVSAQWSRKNGSTLSNHTGPSYDHTTKEFLSDLDLKDGYYMYLNASDYLPSATARLISRTISHGYSGAMCLQFWYHMHGAGMGSLNVYTSNFEGSVSGVWEKIGDQRDAWHLAMVSLTKISGPFQLIIEAIRGPSHLSDMAVDDIQLIPGYCTLTIDGPGVGMPRVTIPTMPGCRSDELKCSTGDTCYPRSGLCDGVAQCDDRSDEYRCSSDGWQNPDDPVSGGAPQCTPGQLRCVLTFECYSILKQCDGYADCKDGSDEKWCYRTGGERLERPPEYIGFATSAVIGASIGGVIVVAAIIACIVVAAKWRSISVCVAASAQRRCSARRRILHDSVDRGLDTSRGRPPQYPAHPMTAPPYAVEPPPYSPRDNSKPVEEPPTYEQFTSMSAHEKDEHAASAQQLIRCQLSESEAEV